VESSQKVEVPIELSLVRRKDGSFRLCIDYKGLNEIIIKNKFPIPFIGRMLDELDGSKYLSKLYLRLGYYQFHISLEDIQKTALIAHEGHYEFKVMLFGLTNAQATFQAARNRIFHPYLKKFVFVFFVDILLLFPGYKAWVKSVKFISSCESPSPEGCLRP
jgi:hypothetical protein